MIIKLNKSVDLNFQITTVCLHLKISDVQLHRNLVKIISSCLYLQPIHTQKRLQTNLIAIINFTSKPQEKQKMTKLFNNIPQEKCIQKNNFFKDFKNQTFLRYILKNRPLIFIIKCVSEKIKYN